MLMTKKKVYCRLLEDLEDYVIPVWYTDELEVRLRFIIIARKFSCYLNCYLNLDDKKGR